MSKWIKCSKHTPEMTLLKGCMSEHVVVMCDDGYPRIDFILNDKWFNTKNPIYWMPLPELPKEE